MVVSRNESEKLMKERDEVGTSDKKQYQQTRNCGFVTYSHNVQIKGVKRKLGYFFAFLQVHYVAPFLFQKNCLLTLFVFGIILFQKLRCI